MMAWKSSRAVVAEDVERFGQDRVAKLEQSVFRRMGAGIIQGQGLGFEMGQVAGERRS